MEIVVDEEKKIVEVWLSRLESESPKTDEILKSIYNKYRLLKYKTVIFRSGKSNLIDCIESLIRSNKRKFAEQEVKQQSN